MVTPNDIAHIDLINEELDQCIANAQHIYHHIIDRHDLHTRDNLERFENVLMGEVAELSVIKWLQSNGKFAESAVNKTSEEPDLGHDIRVRDSRGNIKLCSIKSSLSFGLQPDRILNELKLATKASELRDINIQVYYWYRLYPGTNQHRVSVPSTSMMGIFAWFANRDLLDENFVDYNHEKRKVPEKPLKDGHPMEELLQYLS